MALGVPFAVRAWRRRRSWFSFFGLSVLAAGLFVNATRGVWFGLIVAGLLALLTRRRARAWLAVTLPVAAIGGWIGYLAFATSPFLKRLMNPVDLIERFEYWEVGAKMLLAHPLIGVGPTRFKEAYLAYVEKFGTSANFDVTQVVTPDNLFLSTAAEQGLIGLAGLMVFLIFALVLLKKSRARLHRRGLTAEASLVRCSELALVVYVGAGCFADVEWFSKATKLLFILIGIGLAEGARHAVRTGNMGMCTPKADRAT
jgi:O-antigen ligase